MKIDISQKDFGILCICALRYCHGRKTYMPSLVQSIVLAHKDDLNDKDKFVILEDEGFQRSFGLWGEDVDKTDWIKFYEEMKV